MRYRTFSSHHSRTLRIGAIGLVATEIICGDPRGVAISGLGSDGGSNGSGSSPSTWRAPGPKLRGAALGSVDRLRCELIPTGVQTLFRMSEEYQWVSRADSEADQRIERTAVGRQYVRFPFPCVPGISSDDSMIPPMFPKWRRRPRMRDYAYSAAVHSSFSNRLASMLTVPSSI